MRLFFVGRKKSDRGGRLRFFHSFYRNFRVTNFTARRSLMTFIKKTKILKPLRKNNKKRSIKTLTHVLMSSSKSSKKFFVFFCYLFMDFWIHTNILRSCLSLPSRQSYLTMAFMFVCALKSANVPSTFSTRSADCNKNNVFRPSYGYNAFFVVVVVLILALFVIKENHLSATRETCIINFPEIDFKYIKFKKKLYNSYNLVND